MNILKKVKRRWSRQMNDTGMITAEYAVGIIVACSFAAVLYKIVTGSAVSSAIARLIERALGATF